MIVGCPEFFQGSQIVVVGRSPSALCQGVGIDVAEAVGIVVGSLAERLFSQLGGLPCAGKSHPAGLQLLQGHCGVFCQQAFCLL